jgi:translation initiation factor 1
VLLFPEIQLSLTMAKYKFTGVVYSTNPDFKYQSAEQAEAKTLPAQQQDLRVWLEKGGRGGKQASVIKGFVGTHDDLEQLARELKTHCATGGSAKDGEIIIQGDNRDKIVAYLQKKLFKVKKAGG